MSTKVSKIENDDSKIIASTTLPPPVPRVKSRDNLMQTLQNRKQEIADGMKLYENKRRDIDNELHNAHRELAHIEASLKAEREAEAMMKAAEHARDRARNEAELANKEKWHGTDELKHQ